MIFAVRFDQNQIDRANFALANVQNGAPRALANAINRAVNGIRTDIVAAVVAEYAIKPSDVRKTIRVRGASPANLTGAAISTGGTIPLIKFNVNPKKPKRVPVLRAGVRMGNQEAIPQAFTATMRGHTGVFMRKGKNRFPLRELYAPSIPQLIGNERVIKVVQDNAGDRLSKNLDHEIDRLLRGFGA